MTMIVATGTSGKTGRATLIARLRRRDGDFCMYPGCDRPLDFSVKSGSGEVTIDHWMPQYFGKANGWTPDEIWAESNLKLMHKKCNAAKGDRIPNEDGTLPPRPAKTFRYRRDKRASRLDGPCEVCDNGHNLGVDEVCAQCGMNAKRYPRWAKVPFPECDHELFWCWVCSITPEMRPSSIGTAMRQGSSDELGEPVSDTDYHLGSD
jgi:hypothetical protein